MKFKNGHIADYQYKSEILKDTDLIRTQKLVSRSLFVQGDVIDRKTGEVMTYENAKGLDMLLCNDSDWIEAGKINYSAYKRAKRLRNRISWMLSLGPCIFLTLTFKESVLESTSEETRKKYVKRFLKSQSDQYVANIDFGAEKEREHYHAVILCPKVDFTLWHQYGGIKGEKIRASDKSPVRLGKYISKLTNHAIKETTKRCAIIYSAAAR